MQQVGPYSILLGGVGGDSHSVGLAILRQALFMNGYRVHFLGTQNRLEDFFMRAGLCNVVMISSMDGHARQYLSEFPELMRRHKASTALWYLGGNLHVGEKDPEMERYFLQLGFHRVFLTFIDVNTVLALLGRDLLGAQAIPESPTLWEHLRPVKPYIPAQVADDGLELDAFYRDRREVLEHWSTGRGAASLEENAEFLGRQPSFPEAQAWVNAGRTPVLFQPRSGVPLVDEQIKLFNAFKSFGVRVLSYQVDSLTRNNNYVGAEEAIRESCISGHSTINGFPVVNHGVPGLRKVISEVKVPLQTRHSTRDPRLLAEISYAGGVTAFEGGAVCYNIPYYRDYPLDESIRTWQYVDRLTGIYFDRFGIALDREFFGTLTATLIPPSLAIAVTILEAILAIRQGVRCVSLGYAEQGNRIQDIAAIRTLGKMAGEVIRNLGYKQVQVNTVFHQYMAAFPQVPSRAEELICNSAVTAALSSATRMIVKTPAEAYKIPSMADNLHGLSLVMRGLSCASEEHVDERRVTEECAIIRRETQAILDSIILCGRGAIAEGVIKGFREGFLDIPFSPSIYNRGEVMTARDVEGAVRFLSIGNLQFDRELREFHRDKMQERLKAEGLSSANQSYLLVERDVLQIARGQYERWPLFG